MTKKNQKRLIWEIVYEFDLAATRVLRWAAKNIFGQISDLFCASFHDFFSPSLYILLLLAVVSSNFSPFFSSKLVKIKASLGFKWYNKFVYKFSKNQKSWKQKKKNFKHWSGKPCHLKIGHICWNKALIFNDRLPNYFL